jgi:CysZ protein
MDFTMERHLSVKSSIAFIRDNRGLAIGNGLVFIVMLMIPIFGLLLAPPLAVIAATIGTVRKLPIR